MSNEIIHLELCLQKTEEEISRLTEKAMKLAARIAECYYEEKAGKKNGTNN